MTDSRAPIHDGRNESSLYGCVTCGLSVADHDNACRDGNGCTDACARRHAARDPDYAAYLQAMAKSTPRHTGRLDCPCWTCGGAKEPSVGAVEAVGILSELSARYGHLPLVPPDEVLLAQRDAALDALERLVHAFPELAKCLSTPPQQRALMAAMSLLADAGRGAT